MTTITSQQVWVNQQSLDDTKVVSVPLEMNALQPD